VLDTLAGEGLAGEGLAGLKDSTRSPERTLGHAAAPRRGGRG
jgi:hypothetical protein